VQIYIPHYQKISNTLNTLLHLVNISQESMSSADA